MTTNRLLSRAIVVAEVPQEARPSQMSVVLQLQAAVPDQHTAVASTTAVAPHNQDRLGSPREAALLLPLSASVLLASSARRTSTARTATRTTTSTTTTIGQQTATRPSPSNVSVPPTSLALAKTTKMIPTSAVSLAMAVTRDSTRVSSQCTITHQRKKTRPRSSSLAAFPTAPLPPVATKTLTPQPTARVAVSRAVVSRAVWVRC